MTGSFRQSMAWLHRSAGVLVGWVLYVVFVSGTLSYFHDEISHWMRPELSQARPHPDAIAQALTLLQQRAPDAPRWLIDVPDDRRPTLRLGWSNPPARGGQTNLLRRFESVELDPVTHEELRSRNTRGGEFMRQLHSEFGVPSERGRWMVGVCAMIMFISLLTGIVTHRNILRNLFTFRPGTGPRPWREAHTMAGVLALPYHLMITYTGLVTLMLMYMPAAVDAQYRFDPGGFLMEILPSPGPSAATGRRANLAPIAPMLSEAARRWDGALPTSISIEHPNDAGARIHMRRSADGRISTNAQVLTFDGSSGEVVWSTPEELPALQAYGVLKGLHSAHFSPTALRWLFAFCAMLGAALTASGLILWTVKRLPGAGDSQVRGIGLRVLQVLSRGTIAGIWWAIAGYFLANRLLPVDLAQRSTWEVRCFFIFWALSFGVSALQRGRGAWSTQLIVAALLFALLPVVNALTTSTHLANSLAQGLWIYAGFDLTMLGLAAMFAFGASRVRAHAISTV